jgi:putative ABC transport system ATP-binding protein
LADEPTGNLDSKTGDEILELLRRSCSELGQTIVVVTHDAKAASFADRVIFLRDGHIVDRLKMTGDQSEDIRQIQRNLRALEV